MAAPALRPRPAPLAARLASDRLLPLWIVAALIVSICVLAAVAVGRPWVDGADDADEARPNWLTTDTVRATSGNGEVIKARVALDVPDPDTRAWISSRPAQLALLLQISVAEYDGSEDTGAQRVQGLSAGIRSRVNAFLRASQMAPVRNVVVQDLVFSKP